MKDNLVVESSSKNRMGMADECGMSRFGDTCVQQGFKSSGRAVNKQRADGRVIWRHEI